MKDALCGWDALSMTIFAVNLRTRSPLMELSLASLSNYRGARLKSKRNSCASGLRLPERKPYYDVLRNSTEHKLRFPRPAPSLQMPNRRSPSARRQRETRPLYGRAFSRS